MKPALEHLTEYNTFSVPVSEVWVDADFNCRGNFTPESVTALSQSIAVDGLQYPMVVQPWDEHPQFEYRLVAGFRRFAACKRLNWDEVPAIVTEKGISDFEAHKLNLVENLERQDLNLLQEAEGIRKLFPMGESIASIAKELNRGCTWVQRRVGLLDFPHEIQLMCASGRLTQSDLDTILPYRKDPDKVREIAGELSEARAAGAAQIKAVQRKLHQGRAVPDSRRKKAEIANMIGVMFDMGLDGLPTRVAAWCAGTITTSDIMSDLHEAKKPV